MQTGRDCAAGVLTACCRQAGLHSILLHATMHVAADKTTCATNCNNRSILLRTEPTPPQQTKAPARVRACQHEKTDHTDARAANAHVHCRVRCGKHSTARTSTLVAEPSSSGVGPPMRARAVAPVALQSLHVAGNTHVETCTLQHMQHAPRRMQHATPQSTGQARQRTRQLPKLDGTSTMRAVTCCAQHTTRNAQHARCSTVWHTGGCRTWTAVAQPSTLHAL